MSDPGNLYQNLIRTVKISVERRQGLPDSLEQVATMAGVGVDEVRGSFKSIKELREGLIYDSVTLLNDALRQGIIESDPKSPDAQLRSLARSYGDWAHKHPGLFALLVDGLMGDLGPDDTLYRFTLSMRELFERKLQEMIDIGILDEKTDIARVLLFLHCIIRGANVVLAGQGTTSWIKEGQPLDGNLAELVFDQFFDGLIAQHGKTPLRGA